MSMPNTPEDDEDDFVLPEINLDLFSANSKPTEEPPEDEGLPDLDFSFFEKEENTSPEVLPEIEDSVPEPTSNFDALFEDLDEDPTQGPGEKEATDYDALFEEDSKEPAERQNPESQTPEGWDGDFDKFLEGLDDGPNTSPDEKDSQSEDFHGDPDYVSTFDDEEEPPLKPLKKSSGRKPKKSGGKKKGPLARGSEATLNGISRIPIVGRLFRPLVRFPRIFMSVLIVLVLLAIPFAIFKIAESQVPAQTSASGPDEESVSFSNFTFSDGKISGTLKNTGDVIANVVPTFTVWVFGPPDGSLFSFEKKKSCVGDLVSVDIDGSATVSLDCPVDEKGLAVRVSGSAQF